MCDEWGYPTGYSTRTVVLSVAQYDEWDLTGTYHVNQSEFEAGELVTHQMIKDGYLELANHLVLRRFGSDFNEEAIQLVRDFACTSQIKYFEADARVLYGRDIRISNFATFIDILKDSKCAEKVHVTMDVDGVGRNFEIFWYVLTTILQMKKIKDIRFDLRRFYAEYGFLDLLNNYSDASLGHVKSISVCVRQRAWFKYGESNEPNMKDFAEKFRGQFAINFLNISSVLAFIRERCVEQENIE